MNRKTFRESIRRGGILISTLAFVVIVSILMAGVGTLAVSHYARAKTESDYAAALNLAEAGINYEIRNISLNMVTNSNAIDRAYPSGGQNGAYTGAVSGITGAYTVKVYAENSDGTLANTSWAPPSPAIIRSTGTVNGVSRTVQIEGTRKSLFDIYALFGIDSTSWNGGVIVNGTFGTNNSISISGSSGEVYGSIIYNGSSGSTFPSGQTTGGVSYEPTKTTWPTVNTLADYYAKLTAVKQGLAAPAAGSGLSWFRSTYNDNSRVMMFDSTDAALSNPAQHAWKASGFAATNQGNWEISNTGGGKTFNTVTTDANAMDAPAASTKRYVYPATTFSFTNPNQSVSVASFGMNGKQVLIFPGSPDPNVPYNYYIDLINLSNSNSVAVMFDTASGPINVWISNLSSQDGTADDNLNGVFYFTSADSTKFRLYDAKTGNGNNTGVLNIGGSSVFNGSIYAYNGANTGKISFSGNPVINGSVIASKFQLGGNPLVNFPASSDAASDYGAWFGFKDAWTEVNGL
jgi:Tfp pilus assembly protein PilX